MMEFNCYTLKKSCELLNLMVEAYDKSESWTDILEASLKKLISHKKYKAEYTEKEISIAYTYMLQAIQKREGDGYSLPLSNYAREVILNRIKHEDIAPFLILLRCTITAVTDEVNISS